jgi:hypothetical protein
MSLNLKSPLKARRPATLSSARPSLACLGAVAIAVAIIWAYVAVLRYVFVRSPGEPVNTGEGATVRFLEGIHNQFHVCPSPPVSAAPGAASMALSQYGTYPQEHSTEEDPEAWLDKVAEIPPPIVPSHYGMVKGEEPYEGKETRPFQLHVVPNDDWYDVAYRTVSRCDRELTGDIVGAANGLADKVVWVSGLFDMKRGEAANGAFNRPIGEYFRRFQNVLDRGFEMVIFIPHEFEQNLTIDKSRIKIIYMNITQLRQYFPYNPRLQSIRTSKLWNEQAVQTGWLSEAPQVCVTCFRGVSSPIHL